MNPFDRFREADAVLARAIELDGRERKAYIDRACADDAELRAIVADLLAERSKSALARLPDSSRSEIAAHIATLPNGFKLDSYEVIAPIGAGGMGEVYRARDTRLGRDVALKVLGSRGGDRSSLRERFEREAQVVAQLQHPHICSLFDVGVANGIEYLVMELLEGETLHQRLGRGPLPLVETLELASQIAGALGRAHEHGIYHRDLKPANIFLTPDGAKLLDFGLAGLEPSLFASSDTAAPTRRRSLTAEGVILGTLQYMSPEQLEGKETDQRSDIFSFGALLYEMVTGEKAFTGESQASLISALLTETPKTFEERAVLAPHELDRLVQTCLRKKPEQRWRSATDLGKHLDLLAKAADDSGIEPRSRRLATTRRRPAIRSFPAWILFAALLGAAATWLLVRPTNEQFVTIAELETDFGGYLDGRFVNFAISPDGRRVAAQRWIGHQLAELRVRQLDERDWRTLRTPESTFGAPVFSPDGEFLFVTSVPTDTWIKVPFDGSPPITLLEDRHHMWASWDHDDRLLISGWQTPIERLHLDSLEIEPLTEIGLDRGHQRPLLLPGTELLLFQRGFGFEGDSTVVVKDLSTGEERPLLEDAQSVSFLGPRTLLYELDGVLWARPFDADTARFTGTPVSVLDDVFVSDCCGAFYDISNDGTLIYLPDYSAEIPLSWYSSKGVRLENLPISASRFSISPNGERLAFSRAGASREDDTNFEVWVRDLSRGVDTFVGEGMTSHWRADGRRLAVTSWGTPQIVSYDPDGDNPPQLIYQSDQFRDLESWLPNGDFLFSVAGRIGGRDFLVGREDALALVESRFDERGPALHPSGEWLAFSSPESGDHEIYLVRVDQPSKRIRVSREGGRQPRWRGGTNELYFVGPEGGMHRTRILDDSGNHSEPERLFDVPFDTLAHWPLYRVHPDGRFLLTDGHEADFIPNLRIIFNWSSQVRKALEG